MPSFEITIPGEFEDAFLYMGRLFVATPEMDIRSVDLRDCLSDDIFGAVTPLTEMFFLRNDHFSQPMVRSLLTEPALNRAVRREATADARILYPRFADGLNESLFGAGAVLDFQMYNKRLYVSTTNGLFHFDLNLDDSRPEVLRSEKRFSARCLSTSIKNGTAIASCGDNGLRVALDEFDWARRDIGHSFTDVSRASRRATWVGYSLVNYPSVSSLEFLKGQKEDLPDHKGARADYVVTGFEHDDGALEQLKPDLDGLDFVFNNGPSFFGQRKSGQYTFTKHRFSTRYKVFGHNDKPSRTGKLPEALSAHGLGDGGIVVETFDNVTLLREEGVERIFEGQSVKVRTFPNSRNHMNVVIVISDDALHLISPIPPSLAASPGKRKPS
ncbi:hypothetical protein ACWCO3_22285 [Micromonospora sp. NPDC002411]